MIRISRRKVLSFHLYDYSRYLLQVIGSRMLDFVRIETKYFPLGFRLMVALKIRPFTPPLLANETKPGLGNFT